MASPYTPTPVDPNAASGPAFAAPYAPAAPAPTGASGPGSGAQSTVPPPPMPLRPAKTKRHGSALVAAAIGAFIAVLIVGFVGLYVGSRLTNGTVGQQLPTEANAPNAAPAPSANQVHAQTVDLCSRFVAGYQAMPSPQNTGFDIIPTINYIADALRDNPVADNTIRTAVGASLTGLREHAMLLSREADHGAIQNPTNWSLDTAAHADQRVWDLCKAYGG
jgi:hypothetical protein